MLADLNLLERFEPYLHRRWAGNDVETWVTVLALLIFGYIGGRVVAFVMARIVPRLTAHTETQIDDQIVLRTGKPIAMLVFFGAAWYAVQHVLHLHRHLQRILVDGVLVAIGVVAAIILLRTIDVLFEEGVEKWAERKQPPVSVHFVYFTRTVLKVLAGTFVAVAMLQRIGFDVLSVLTGLGIGGLAIALAAQETLGNILGSLQIMTDRPFAVGDVIKWDGKTGRVSEIGMRSTKIVLASGVKVIVPNKKIAESAIENHSHVNGLVRDFTLHLSYRTTAAQMREAVDIAKAVLAEQPEIHAEFSAAFAGFDDNALNLRVIYKVQDITKSAAVGETVNYALHERLAGAGLDLAWPTRSVQLLNQPKL